LLIFGNAKIRYLCCLAKWRLINHTLACVGLIEGTLSPQNFLGGEKEPAGAKARARGQLPMDKQDFNLSEKYDMRM